MAVTQIVPSCICHNSQMRVVGRWQVSLKEYRCIYLLCFNVKPLESR